MKLGANKAVGLQEASCDADPIPARRGGGGDWGRSEELLSTVQELVGELDLSHILDLDCGDGALLQWLSDSHPNAACVGVGLSERLIGEGRLAYPQLDLRVGPPQRLELLENSQDLVVASDLFQSLHDPQRVLREMYRVTRRYVLITVPREPHWRLTNLLKLKHLMEAGRSPRHVQRYRKRDFLNMVGGHFRLLSVRGPNPWITVLARKGAA